MPPRQYVRKPKPKSKPSPYRKRTIKRRTMRPRTLRIQDDTVVRINPGKARVQKWMKNTPLNIPGNPSVAGTNGFNIALGTTAYAQSGSMTFDPSGNFGNFSGPISSTAGFASLSTQTLPEWTSLGNLYGQYKVNKITLKFSLSSTGSAQSGNGPQATLFMRYNDEYTPGAPNPTSISEEKNWIRKTFTVEKPTFNYSFYPKVLALYDNLGLATTDARATRSMPWTNMNAPVEILGMKFYFNVPAASATSYINCDVQYDISFKEQT